MPGKFNRYATIAFALTILLVVVTTIALQFRQTVVLHSAPFEKEAVGPLDIEYVILNQAGVEKLGIRTVEVRCGSEVESIEVPTSAILKEGDGSQLVFVKDFDIPFAFVRVPVKTGKLNGSLAEVDCGLFPGDEVVVNAIALKSERAQSLSNEALRSILDAPCHRTEHPTNYQRLWKGILGLFPKTNFDNFQHFLTHAK